MNKPPRPTRASLYGPANALVVAWFVAAGVVTLAHRFVPAAGWLMVHLLLLGGVSTAILLWSQHFAETLLRRPAPGGRAALWARLAGWTAGAGLVTAGMITSLTPLVLAGAIVCGAVAVGHLAVLVLQRRGSARLLGNRFSHLVRYYLLATAILPFGVALGVILARVDVSPDVAGRLYVAHLITTMLGWVGVTVAGTLVLLWPTVLRTRISPRADAAGRRALPVMLGGLLLALAAPAFGLRVLAGAGALVVAVAIVMLGVHVVAQARAASENGTAGTFAATSMAASLVWFLVCVVWFGIAVSVAPSWTVVPGALTDLVAPFAAGFVAQVMVGSMSYLLPVVLGGGPAAQRWSIREMDRWGGARLVVLNACVVLFALPLPSWVAVAVSSLGLLSLLAFLVISLRVLVLQRGASRPMIELPDGAAQLRGPLPVGRVRPAGMAVGAGLVVLAVAGGVAADPTAAGFGGFGASSAGAGAAGGVAATGETTTIQVSMEGMRFSPDVLEVPAGNALVIELTNNDDQTHDLVLTTGVSSGRVMPGETVLVDAGVISGPLAGWCSVAGHRLMGMTLDVVPVGDGVLLAGGDPASDSDAAAGGQHAAHGSHAATGTGGDDALSAVGNLDLMASPGEDFVAYDAVLPPAEDATTHRVTLRVEEVQEEVAPGVTQERWTFNGTSPGPTLRGKVGDTFEITLVNDGSLGHSIDFHAGALAPDEPMRTINPGETLTYTFTATRSGIWMYHCSTMPMSLHIANGMAGAVVIDPPGLSEVDREYLLVQSELYLGEEGGSANEESLAAQTPDLVVFNGYANQYRDRPLPAAPGEKVRVWVLDVGPNRPSSFHVVGGQFDTVFSEGDYLLRDGGSTGTGGSQALALQPAQGGFVELTFPEAGHYTAVSHIMGDAEKGAAAVFEVEEPAS